MADESEPSALGASESGHGGVVGAGDSGAAVARRDVGRRPRTVTVGSPTALIDVNAKERLQSAASAIGLSLEEMVNLVVDSGLVAMPSEDGITDRFTFEELGLRMWNEMSQVPVDQQPLWFAKLAKNQQISLIVTLRHRGLASYHIAESFDLRIPDVNRVWNEYADKVGAQVVGLRMNVIAGNLQLLAERCMDALSRADQHDKVWKIQKELIALFQAIGIVDKAAQKIEHSHTLTDERQREIQKMIELEKKKSVRTEEIKRVDVQVLDPVPTLDAVEETPF